MSFGKIFFGLEGVKKKYVGSFLVCLRRVFVNWGSWVAAKHTTLEQFKNSKPTENLIADKITKKLQRLHQRILE